MKKLKPFIIKASIIFASIFLVSYVVYSPYLKKGVMSSQGDAHNFNSVTREAASAVKKGEPGLFWTNVIFSGIPFHTGLKHAHKPNLKRVVYPHSLFKIPASNPLYLTICLFFGIFILLRILKIPLAFSIGISILYSLNGFNLFSIEAGHINKVLSMIMVPSLIAGVISMMKKKYFSGILLVLYSSMFIMVAFHAQIIYYALLFAGIVFISLFIEKLQKKEPKKIFLPMILLVVVGITGALSVGERTIVNYFFQKDTIRGGSELSSKPSEGISKEYAYSWSLGKAESLTLLYPNLYGGSSSQDIGKNSEVYKALVKNGVPQNSARNFTKHFPMYWGEMPFTGGPNYIGIFLCFFFVLWLFISRGILKKGLLVCFFFFLFLSWGKHFEIFSEFFRSYLPFYNRFRSVSMAVFIVSIVVAIGAGIALKHLFEKKIPLNELKQKLTWTFYIVGGFSLLLLLLGPVMMSLEGPGDGNIKGQVGEKLFNVLYPAIKADRASFIRKDALAALLLSGGIFVSSLFFLTEKLKKVTAIGILLLIGVGDMTAFAKKYITDNDFSNKKEFYSKKDQKRPVDETILQDSDPHYRVLDITKNVFNDNSTAAYHKSIGGYSAVKLSRYQDFIENAITKDFGSLQRGLREKGKLPNLPSLSMLNTRYIILGSNRNDVMINPYAKGNIWHVEKAIMAQNADEEMQKVLTINYDKELIYDLRFSEMLSQETFQYSDSSYAKLVSYHPDTMVYEVFNTEKQLLLFSEIYFNRYNEWQAYVDGKPASHFRANYVLRSMEAPKGKHIITFVMAPWYVETAHTITATFSYLAIIIFFFVLVFFGIKNKEQIQSLIKKR